MSKLSTSEPQCSWNVPTAQWTCPDGSDGVSLPSDQECMYAADGSLQCKGGRDANKEIMCAPGGKEDGRLGLCRGWSQR